MLDDLIGSLVGAVIGEHVGERVRRRRRRVMRRRGRVGIEVRAHRGRVPGVGGWWLPLVVRVDAGELVLEAPAGPGTSARLAVSTVLPLDVVTGSSPSTTSPALVRLGCDGGVVLDCALHADDVDWFRERLGDGVEQWVERRGSP